jgi:hypothetical protein
VKFSQKLAPHYAQINWDSSVVGVLFSNLLIVVFAFFFSMNFGEIVWTYWLQSIIIGIFSAHDMWTVTNFSTSGLLMNDKPVPETKAGKRSTALFFVAHYGFFHFAYMIFLFALYSKGASWFFVLLGGLSFLFAHWHSYRTNRDRDRQIRRNLGSMMFRPYLRIVPMHLTIILGSRFEDSGLIFFMLLKTASDVGMHLWKHKSRLGT